MSNRPAVLLVHGFWGDAAHWAKVIVALNVMGFDTIRAVENPLTSLLDDAERTRKMAKQIEGPVVLVGHSYGGMVISEMGDLPNVIGLVYVAAFAPDAGESAASISQTHPPAAFSAFEPDSDGYLWLARDKFHENFCHDLSSDEGLVMAVTQKAPLMGTFGDTVTAPAWRKKPSWYQISLQDRAIHPDNQKMMSARMGARKVITLESSHASMASHPDVIAALIKEAAEG